MAKRRSSKPRARQVLLGEGHEYCDQCGEQLDVARDDIIASVHRAAAQISLEEDKIVAALKAERDEAVALLRQVLPHCHHGTVIWMDGRWRGVHDVAEKINAFLACIADDAAMPANAQADLAPASGAQVQRLDGQTESQETKP